MGYDIMKSNIVEGKTPAKEPNVKYIVGQTGSGKSSMIYTLEHSNYVVIDNDYWRSYFPNYRDIINEYKTDEIPQIMTTMKIWRKQLIEELSKDKYNLLIHTSATNSSEICEQIKKFQEKDYTTSLLVIACNSTISKLRCCFRYVENVLGKGYGRYATDHNEVYRRIPFNLQQILQNSDIADVSIYDSEHKFVNQFNGHSIEPILHTVSATREMPLSYEQQTECSVICKKLMSQLTENKNQFTLEMFNVIMKALEEVMCELSKNIEKGENEK